MAKPRKIVRTAAQKLAYLDYAEIHNDSVAARDLGISSPKSLRDWRAIRPQLEKLASKSSRRKTRHKGKQTRYKNVEVRLRVWITDRRDRKIVVTRRMVMSRAKLWDARLAALTEDQRDRWWKDFRRCEGVTTCRISSYSKGGTEQFLEALVRRYHANIHRVFRRFVLWVSGC